MKVTFNFKPYKDATPNHYDTQYFNRLNWKKEASQYHTTMERLARYCDVNEIPVATLNRWVTYCASQLGYNFGLGNLSSYMRYRKVFNKETGEYETGNAIAHPKHNSMLALCWATGLPEEYWMGFPYNGEVKTLPSKAKLIRFNSEEGYWFASKARKYTNKWGYHEEV